MDIEIMMKMVDSQTDQKFKKLVNLGQFIALLKCCDETVEIRFDFPCQYQPVCFGSYRGYYRYLAISYQEHDWRKENSETTVGKLLKEAEKVLGKTLTGYKGGDFLMTEKTPLFVSNYGDSEGVGVVAINDLGSKVIIETKYVED